MKTNLDKKQEAKKVIKGVLKRLKEFRDIKNWKSKLTTEPTSPTSDVEIPGIERINEVAENVNKNLLAIQEEFDATEEKEVLDAAILIQKVEEAEEVRKILSYAQLMLQLKVNLENKGRNRGSNTGAEEEEEEITAGDERERTVLKQLAHCSRKIWEILSNMSEEIRKEQLFLRRLLSEEFLFIKAGGSEGTEAQRNCFKNFLLISSPKWRNEIFYKEKSEEELKEIKGFFEEFVENYEVTEEYSAVRALVKKKEKKEELEDDIIPSPEEEIKLTEEEEPKGTEVILSTKQKRARDDLEEIVALKIVMLEERNTFLTPNTNALVIGDSDSGKDTIVKSLASKYNCPLLKLSPGLWIIAGSRSHEITFETIKKFVQKYPKGIIEIDQIDKLRRKESEWNSYVIQEIVSLLEGNLPPKGREDDEDEEGWSGKEVKKLQDKFVIIGVGTWPEIWGRKDYRTESGKQEDGNEWRYSDKSAFEDEEQIREILRTDPKIPLEVFRKFNRKIVILEKPKETDVKEVYEKLEERMSEEYRQEWGEKETQDFEELSLGYAYIQENHTSRLREVYKTLKVLQKISEESNREILEKRKLSEEKRKEKSQDKTDSFSKGTLDEQQ